MLCGVCRKGGGGVKRGGGLEIGDLFGVQISCIFLAKMAENGAEMARIAKKNLWNLLENSFSFLWFIRICFPQNIFGCLPKRFH